MKKHSKLMAIFLSLLLIIPGSSMWILSSKEKKTNEYSPTTSSVVCINKSTNKQYTTIEKALEDSQSGNVLMVVPPTKDNYHETNNNFIPDKVTYKITKDCIIPQGVSLVIPTDASTSQNVTNASTLNTYIESMQKDDHSRGDSAYSTFATAAENKFLRVTIQVEDNVTITNYGTLVVSGYLSGGTSNGGNIGQTSHSYSRILLGTNSKIIQDGTSSVTHCYGYISETSLNNKSEVDFKSGKLYAPFILNDYRGFSFSWAMTDGAIKNQGSSPFNRFEFINIDSIVKIHAAASFYAVANVYLNYPNQNITRSFTEILNFIGNSQTFFIQLTDATYSYIEYKMNKSTTIASVKFFGGMALNTLELKLTASASVLLSVTIDLSTGTAYFPLSYQFDVELNPAENQANTIYDFTKQKIKLLPGSKLKINENCQVNANEIIAYSAFYDGAVGNGKNSTNGYNSFKYPIKEGAVLVNLGKINATNIAGNVYSDENNLTISSSSNSIVSKEAWAFQSSGSLNPAWTISEYLEIREKLNVVPVDYLTSKKHLYIGSNVFSNYNQFLPVFDVLTNGNKDTYHIDKTQSVLHFDTITNYRLEFLNDVYKAYYGTSASAYPKDRTISYANNTNMLGVINSTLPISSDANGINEFDVQSVSVYCKTPEVNGKVPLYVGKSISLDTEIDDIEKAYDKKVTWSSKSPEIATVDQLGNVTGHQLGQSIITATCDGKSGTYTATVIEEQEIEKITEIYITGSDGGTSKTVKGTDDNMNTPNKEYHGEVAANNASYTLTVHIVPETAPFMNITWVFNGSGTDRNHAEDRTTEASSTFDDNRKELTIHTTGNTGVSPDGIKITCTVTDLDGKKFSAIFGIRQKASLCIVDGTMLTLEDGTQKSVEDITSNDRVLVFNHYTGQYEGQPLLYNSHVDSKEKTEKVVTLRFSDNTELGIVGEHGLFDLDLNKYVFINSENYKQFMYHRFVKAKYENDEFVNDEVILVDGVVEHKVVHLYSPVSYYHLNIVSNGILSMPSFPCNSEGFVNYFEYDSNLKFDEKLMQKDIEKYGLYTFEDYQEYIPYELYYAAPWNYFKVSVGKGKLTWEDILYTIDYIFNSGEITPY